MWEALQNRTSGDDAGLRTIDANFLEYLGDSCYRMKRVLANIRSQYREGLYKALTAFNFCTSSLFLWSFWMSELPPTVLPPMNVFGTVR